MLHVRIWLSVVIRGVFFSKLPTWPPLWRPRHLLQHLTPRKLQMVTNDSNEKIKRFWLAGICSTNFFYAFFRLGIRPFNRKILILQVEHADVIASYQHFMRIRSCSLVLLESAFVQCTGAWPEMNGARSSRLQLRIGEIHTFIYL